MKDFFALYDAILDAMGADADEITLSRAHTGARWAMAEADGRLGLAMAESMESVPPIYPNGLEGQSLREAARGIKSWNLREAAQSLAAINAYFNTPSRMESLGCEEPYENYCTGGMRFDGMRIGVIGHMHLTPEIRAQAGQIYTFEREPQEGDYPDSAAEALLPTCEAVFISGSTLANKTLPRLLELCESAATILVGPSVPMCGALRDFGITRLSGLVVTAHEEMRARVISGARGNPYSTGRSFLIK